MRTEVELLKGAAAFKREDARWGMRFNKAFSPGHHEVFRANNDGDAVVKCSATDPDTALNELEEMRELAAMKAALRAIGEDVRNG